MALEITDANFQETVLNSTNRLLLTFGRNGAVLAAWSDRSSKKLVANTPDTVVVGKVNVDHNPGITAKFGIRNIPTLLFFKGGQVVDKQVGAVPKQIIVGKLQSHL